LSLVYYIHTQSTDSDEQSVTVFVVGTGQDSCDNTHPNFEQILGAAQAADPDVLDLFDVERTVATHFEQLSERVSVAHGVIYLDGDPIDNALTEQVLAFLDAGVTDWQPLVNFFEKVQANPNTHSREQLYAWMRADSTLTITSEGNIVGYKGVRKDGDKLVSVRSGPGIVNGEAVFGSLDNSVGNIVEMPRSTVQHDPSVGCAVGLHVGTWSYASSWAQGAVLKVLVDPRDVVSVPTDCSAQKMRVCRYTVLEVAETRYESPFTDDWDDEYDEDYCDVCDGPCQMGL
jgi:hypothetical protein